MKMMHPSSNQNKLFALLLTICWFSGCALHQTGTDKSAEGRSSKDTSGPKSAEKISVRGPVVLALVSDTDKEEAILIKTQKYATKSENEIPRPAKIDQAMALQGLVGIKVGTLPSILREIQKNRPIAALTKTEDGYRYQLLVGAELRDEILIIKDRGKMMRVKFSQFFQSWRFGNFWARTYISPEEIQPLEVQEAFKKGVAMEASRPLLARRTFRRAARLENESADYLIAWANNVAHRNKRKAIELLKRAVSVEPNKFESWYNLAAMQSLAGRKSAAAATSRKILAMFKWRAPKRRLESLRSLAAK